MGIDDQVAFYHEMRKDIFTGTIIGKEGTRFKISYFDGKNKVVAIVATTMIILLDK